VPFVPPASLLVVVLALLVPPATAQEPARASPPDAVRYRLVVEAPDPPASSIREGLDLARWQGDEEMTLELLERLVREAAPQARELAAIAGFYSAEVSTSIDRTADPLVVTVRVVPGAPVRVTSVAIDVEGPASTDSPQGANAIAEVREGWRLRLGEVFRQAAWIEAKNDAERRMRRSPYASARIARSEARVTPAESSAALAVTLDSGPPFRIGPLRITGNRRYPASLIENFSTLRRGEPYSEAALDNYVRRLAQSGYFASVQARIDPDRANPDDATVEVSVIEAPTHRLEGALSFSTDTRFGARAAYTNVNLDDRALQMRLDAQVEQREQLVSAAFTWPPTRAGWIHTLRASGDRSDYNNVVDTTALTAWGMRGVDERGHFVAGAGYYFTRQEPEGAPTTRSHATYVDAGYVMRRVDDILQPTRGFMADLRAGVGVPGLSSDSFGRAVALFSAWYPIDRDTQLAFRAEAGGVFGAPRDRVPAALLFRTGGDTTVRGYAYQSLGVRVGDAVVAGRYYALGSVEAIRWVTDVWGFAAFVDAGDAADSVSDLDVAVGYGIGARLRTPIGPFRLDLAWGERTRELRLHISVGLSF
jgi:translocation and assembly module TamA